MDTMTGVQILEADYISFQVFGRSLIAVEFSNKKYKIKSVLF